MRLIEPVGREPCLRARVERLYEQNNRDEEIDAMTVPTAEEKQQALLDAAGRIVAWRHRVVGPSINAAESPATWRGGIDSFAVEPMTAPHPFHGVANILLSPHIGGVTSDAYINMGLGAARNVLDVLATQ